MDREKLTQEDVIRMLGLAETMRSIGVSRQRVLQVLEVSQHTLDCWARRYGSLPISMDGWDCTRDQSRQIRSKQGRLPRI
jgi:hypothetical protein